MNTLFLPAEVATRWRVRTEQVLKLIYSGKLRAMKFGPKTFRIPLDAILECERCEFQLSESSAIEGDITPHGSNVVPLDASLLIPKIFSVPKGICEP
jgi:excisionase family DNA binding protein